MMLQWIEAGWDWIVDHAIEILFASWILGVALMASAFLGWLS